MPERFLKKGKRRAETKESEPRNKAKFRSKEVKQILKLG